MTEQFHKANHREVVPPASLQQKFYTDYPNASDVEWESANDLYEVEFEIWFRDFKAIYHSDGTLLMTVEEIRSSQLPAVVKTAAETSFPKFGLEDATKIRRGTRTVYLVEMERTFSDAEVVLLINADGTMSDEKFNY
jgi:hypothetical protein